MRRSRQLAFGPAAALALLAALALAAPASARKYQMSGTWVARRGGVFVPLQFVATYMGTGQNRTHVSMGQLTGAFGYPNGPIVGGGGVTATGSAPATLRVPRHRFVAQPFTALPLDGFTFVQITTRFDVDAPFETATLAPSGGPGSFTWCPGDPDCVDGPGAMLASDPPQGAGTGNGRIIYRAGANRFGGVIQLGLAGGSVTSLLFATNPVQVFHVRGYGVGPTPFPGAPGGAYAFTWTVMLPGPVVTRPLAFVPGQVITQPGPKLTTMGGFTDTGTGATRVYPPNSYATIVRHGFPATTGTVFVQQTHGSDGDDFFSLMGSDMRSALGAGNISLVSGGLTLRGWSVQATFDKVQLTLAAPVPSLSPAAFAASAVLVLLGAGYARGRARRRAAGRSEAGSDEGSNG